MRILSIFVLPCFVAESVYKIWWYTSGLSKVPFLANVYVSISVACILEPCSWLYRTTVFFLVCVLFRLICYLQILRLQDFAIVFQVESDVGSIMSEHLRIRRHLAIISHRFRGFILWSLTLITGSQFALLLITTKSHAGHYTINYQHIFIVGELVLCCLTSHIIGWQFAFYNFYLWIYEFSEKVESLYNYESSLIHFVGYSYAQ